MKDAFLQNIKSYNLPGGKETILLAVSGGVDSMVMTHLFTQCNVKIAIAHCNFQLRGKESDKDEALVKKIAGEFSIPFHHKKFNTSTLAVREKQSIQVLARELRYKWFFELAKKYHYSYVATAHHKDDAIESFFINLTRGTGIKGLTGIPVRNELLIRPMLCFTKEQIREYAVKYKINYREDSSNTESYYLRNQVRHSVIPALQNIQPGFMNIMSRNLTRLSQESILLQEFLSALKEKMIIKDGRAIRINMNNLLQSPQPSYLLLNILEPFGFNHQQVDDIYSCLHQQPGKEFSSRDYRLIKDREDLILVKKEMIHLEISGLKIEQKSKNFTYKNTILPYRLHINIRKITKRFVIDNQPVNAQFDFDTIAFPLVLRKWADGDIIYPLGMKGKKKVSDVLTDIKLPRNLKDETWVLCSRKDIIWIPGIRMDERFKINNHTKTCLEISLLYT
jgi:tRNA(Ile)-lysidine synthase